MNNDIRAIFEAFVTPTDDANAPAINSAADLAKKYQVAMQMYGTFTPEQQQAIKREYQTERKGITIDPKDTREVAKYASTALNTMDSFFEVTPTPGQAPTALNTEPQLKTTPAPTTVAPRPEAPAQPTPTTTSAQPPPPSTSINPRPADTTPATTPPRAPSLPLTIPTVNVPKPGEIKTPTPQAQPAPTTATPAQPVPTTAVPTTNPETVKRATPASTAPYIDTTKGRRLTTRR